MDKQHERTKKKAFSSIAAIAVLFGMLALTTYALIASFVSVDDHLFQTGTVEIQLNGGRAVFDGSDMNVEPGHSLVLGSGLLSDLSGKCLRSFAGSTLL